MKLKSKLLREIIYAKIIEYIGSGKITPGEKLTEGRLAKHFNVSRTPVREALLQLEKKGLVVLHPNFGAVVKKISIQQIEQIFNLVSVLEGYAVETVVNGGIEEGDLSYLYKHQEEMESLAAEKNYFRYAEKNTEFHSFFVKKTKNDILSEILKDLRSRVYTVGLTLPLHIDQYLLRHRMIIEAISTGDPHKAGLLMREHVQELSTFLRGMLKQLRGIPTFYDESRQGLLPESRGFSTLL
jgi:DNA-binding GntR family transcriptional regulator